MKILFVAVIVLSALIPAEGKGEDRRGRLDSVYTQLVRRETGMFPAEEWSVTDLRVIREILYQVHNSSRIPEAQIAAVPLAADEVEVVCRKRIDDDEIQTLLLSFPDGSGRDTARFDDYVFVRSLLGDQLYGSVKGYRGTGKDDFEKDLARTTDLTIHPLRPSFQLWSTQPSAAASYAAVSVFGRLGNDALDLPFWFRGTMVGGLAFRFIDRPSAVRDPGYDLYAIRVGIEEPMNFSVPYGSPPSPNSFFKPRKLQGSGTAVFLSTKYAPWTEVPFLGIDTAGFVQLTLELCVAIEHKERFSPRLPEEFYSVRNSATFFAEVKRLGIFNCGAGFAWHDMHHLTRDALNDNRASRIEPPVGNVLALLELGVADDGGVVQYDIRTGIHYSLTDGYGFFVVKPTVMVSNIIGVEVQYFKAFRAGRLPSWHYDNYLVFAPVLRINF